MNLIDSYLELNIHELEIPSDIEVEKFKSDINNKIITTITKLKLTLDNIHTDFEHIFSENPQFIDNEEAKKNLFDFLKENLFIQVNKLTYLLNDTDQTDKLDDFFTIIGFKELLKQFGLEYNLENEKKLITLYLNQIEE
jgi:hypothetical protein